MIGSQSTVDWGTYREFRMEILNVIQFGIVIFAILAAVFWFMSAMVKIPNDITSGYGGVGGSAQELGHAISRQGCLSAKAAACAGVAALLQAISLII